VPTFQRLILTLHGLALAVWLAALVASGLFAATLFPTMKTLNPLVPAFREYAGEHWRLAAGVPANNIFTLADRIQFVCAGAALMTLGFWLAGLARRKQEGDSVSLPAAVLRITTLTGAMAGLCYQLFILGPRMGAALRNWVVAATEGRTSDAEAFRAIFDADHPAASRTLGLTALCVLMCLTVHLWNGDTVGPRRPGVGL